MDKIVSFTRATDPVTGSEPGPEPEAFVDDGELLEFPQAARHPPAPDPAASLFASDWTNQELADLYRAHTLVQAAQPGLDAERGISDEGDPWFLIGKANGDVLVHICRIQGVYILDSVALSHVLSGHNFNSLVENFLSTVTKESEEKTGSANVVRLSRGETICLHPSMMIAALVWSLLHDADELTLPVITGSDDTCETKAMPEASLAPERAYSGKTDCFETLEQLQDDSAFFLNSRERAMFFQRDDKLLPCIVPSYSNALTTVAISAGVYASLGSIEDLRKFTETFSDTSTPVEGINISETSGVNASLELLPKALTLLANLDDLDIFERSDDQAAETDAVPDETGMGLSVEVLVAPEMLTGEEMLAAANEALSILTDISFAKNAEPPDESINTLFDKEEYMFLEDSSAERNPGQDTKHNAKDRLSDDSIKAIAAGLISVDPNINKLDISLYETSSFKERVDEFDKGLDEYAEIPETEYDVIPEDDEPAPSLESDEPASVTPSMNTFSSAARNYLGAKIHTADLEILVFSQEIIFIDKETSYGDRMSMTWQLEDGGLISMIGLSSELSEFTVA